MSPEHLVGHAWATTGQCPCSLPCRLSADATRPGTRYDHGQWHTLALAPAVNGHHRHERATDPVLNLRPFTHLSLDCLG
eukprot:CAMPEP_0181189448 /NCGR_PEP_ID=MMETSP1096-20121128/11665_1 /TAXON_ID=156174 ORGANISM="Chrysochromulina ericina, Strain CCMP281" /NCGR_SAMPLE_ID=MMETSP1096 /ASSEMBLY_ACC=CAM_ASM_000453 /LENGTH=78 /DNA_ID=CAMNT_0023278597 /DNA_START=366 /DNA_END=599 /DNA_ORIENTATION=-